MRLQLDVSAGELLDRITILEIKVELLPKCFQVDIRSALNRARRVRDEQLAPCARLEELLEALRSVNRELWRVEEELRGCERERRFGAEFVKLARSVYLLNDRRAAIKLAVDTLVGSEVREHKSHRLPNEALERRDPAQ